MDQTYRDRLSELLEPDDPAEHATIDYLAATTPRQSAIVIELLTRAVARARAAGFDAGYSEGVDYRRSH